MSFRKILIVTDFSPEGERALRPVVALAAELHATVLLLHVVENPGCGPLGKGGGVPAPPMLAGTKEEVELAKKKLDERRAKFPAGVEVLTDVIVGPSVPHSINDYAVEKGCDVIALSTHGRTGFRRMIVGSVAEAVLRGARVPVLVFPRQA